MNIQPTASQLQTLATASDDDGAVTMLNLLRFKERADGIDAADGITGAEAYARYGAAVQRYLHGVGGKVLLMATVDQVVIGPEAEGWDMMLLAEYPSRKAFLQMTSDPGYLAAHGHRAAALLDSRLIACRVQEG